MRDDGVRYEEYCCEYLKEKGYSTRKTAASGDQGADIIAEKDGIRIAVQCKYRTEGSVGNDAIQQALAGKMYYDCDLALVITNVSFTSQAVSAAQRLKVKIWPNIRMKIKLPAFSPNVKETEYDADDLNYASLSPFVFDVSSVLAETEEMIEYGKTLINSRFEIPYVSKKEEADSEDDFYSFAGNRIPQYYTNSYQEGRIHADRVLSIINEISKEHFEIVDWFYSADRDKALFVFETTTDIKDAFREELQNELNRLLGLEINMCCPMSNTLVVSIINIDKDKTDNINDLVKYVIKYVNENTTRSIISTDSNTPLVTYETLKGVTFNNRYDNPDDYEFFYRFNCSEQIDDNIITSLEEDSNAFFRRRIIIRRMDSHSFVLCIKKTIGLEDYLTVIDVNKYHEYDSSQLLSVAAGICENSILFSVKLKNVDISNYEKLLTNDQSKAAVTSYLEQIRYFVMGLFNLSMIDFVKHKKIDLPLCKSYRGYWAEGIRIEDINIRIVDANNQLIIWDDACLGSNNGLTVFPIRSMIHQNFIGRNDSKSYGNTGLNAMMIQKTLKDLPKIAEWIGSYFIIDTLKKLINEYTLVLDRFIDIFVSACKALEQNSVTNKNICVIENEYYCRYFLNIKSDEIEKYHNCEYSNIWIIKYSLYFWKIVSTIRNRNLIWGDPEKYDYKQVDNDIKNSIEKLLNDKGYKYKLCGNSYPNKDYLLYKIQDRLDIQSFETEICEQIQKIENYDQGHVFIYKRELNKYAFVLNDCAGIYYPFFYSVLQRIKNQKEEGNDLSYWMIDQNIKPYCLFQSFSRLNRSTNFYPDYALLAIKLKNVSIKSLETLQEAAKVSTLWGVWNDMIYSLKSLLLFSMGINRLENNKDIYAGIELYDKNNILIAQIFSESLQYSYFQCYDPKYKHWTNGAFVEIKTEYKKPYDEYRKEIVPILNSILQKAFNTLEELSTGSV